MASRREILKASVLLPMIATAAGVEGVEQTGEGRRVVVVGAGAFGGWTALELRTARRATSRCSTRGVRATPGPAPAARPVSSARPTARAPSTRRWPSARWPCGAPTTPGGSAASSARPARCGCSAPTIRSGAPGDRAGAEKLPIEELTPQAAAKRFPQIRSTTPSSPCSGSRRPGISRAPRVRARGRALHRGRGRVPAVDRAGAGDRDGPLRRLARPTAPHSRRTRSCSRAVRGWAALSRPRRHARDADAPGGLLLRHATGRHAVSRSGDAGVGRLRRAVDVRHSGQREPRVQGGGRHARPHVRPDGRHARDAPPASRPRALSWRGAFPRSPARRSSVPKSASTKPQPDSHFIIDRHPAAANVWIAGGGSGHGFKMGPAIGERVASYAITGSAPDPQFGLARLASPPPPGGWEEKWS